MRTLMGALVLLFWLACTAFTFWVSWLCIAALLKYLHS